MDEENNEYIYGTEPKNLKEGWHIAGNGFMLHYWHEDNFLCKSIGRWFTRWRTETEDRYIDMRCTHCSKQFMKRFV